MRRFEIRSILALLAVALVIASGPAVAIVLSGCRAVESTFDGIGNLAEGTALGDVAHGVARGAEGLRDYSPSEEHYIGRAVAAEILTMYKVHDDARLAEYVNLVGQAVVKTNPDVLGTLTGYHFTIIEGDEVNAISAPAGFVFLTVGTVRKARNEDELAAILAHEVAHVTLRHGINTISKATRKQSLALILQGASKGLSSDARTKNLGELTAVFGSAVGEITNALLKGYSRESELEADALAVKFLKTTAYSQAALPVYLGTLGSAGGKGGWDATHPAPRDRIGALREKAEPDPAAVLAGVPLREKRFQAAF